MPVSTESESTTITQKLLGAFIVSNCVLLLISNIAGFWRAFPRPLGNLADRYTEISCQLQGWGMFERGDMRNSVAWDVRIELDDEQVERISSVAQLPDGALYHPPAARSRRFVYESAFLGMDLLFPEEPYKPEVLIEDVRSSNGSYLAFFRSIYERERKPNWPKLPKSMELAILRQPVVPMRNGEVDPVVRYVCRWRPAETSPAFLDVEAYDLDAPDPPYRRLPR